MVWKLIHLDSNSWLCHQNIEPQIIPISDDVCLQSQTDVKVLGITADYRLAFNEHIRICTLKAASQLNALSRISKYLDTKSKSVHYHSFLASNFNYCPIVWHFCRIAYAFPVKETSPKTTRSNWWMVSIDSGNGLVPPGNKTLPEPMLTEFCEAMCRQ